MKINDNTYQVIIDKLKRKLQPLDNEHIMLVDLNKSGQPEHFITLAKGEHGGCSVSLRKVSNHIIDYSPKGLILAHNHPGNTPFPSELDNDITKTVLKLCNRMDVKLVDHVIILKDCNDFFSYKKNNCYAKKVGMK